MRFTKMQGAGNDFIIIDDRDGSIPRDALPGLAKRLCERRVSVGADAMIAVLPPEKGGDYGMLFYNTDGTLGEMCGNGARCIARYGHDRGLAGDIQHIETTAGPVIGQRITEDRYRVRLNDPSVLCPRMSVTVDGENYDCGYAELGDPGIPHAVLLMPDWDSRDISSLRELGRRLRHAAEFPKGANVSFFRQTAADALKAITFERGVEDFTLACGTGCGSMASMALLWGMTGSDVDIQTPGGLITVSLHRDGETVRDIFITGPAVTVYEAELCL